LREGADFDKIAKENSDPGVVTEGRGKAEKVKVTELAEILKGPLKDVKVGGVTEPIEVKDLGIVILRVDAREQASSESFY
ncbi:peptidyl-prolyl cis-trans isomerase, partial [Escherichia coli]|nr:peptidyl-prolyl cis-trans isomerase [Escherichia coli]